MRPKVPLNVPLGTPAPAKNFSLSISEYPVFNNLSNFAVRPEHLDPSFDDIIKDAGTQKLSTEQKIKYMEALHLNERERLVIHEGGYIIGKEDGFAEGEAKGKAEVASAMLADGMSPALVSKYTGLTLEEIASLN